MSGKDVEKMEEQEGQLEYERKKEDDLKSWIYRPLKRNWLIENMNLTEEDA